jgi:hypothetical protein
VRVRGALLASVALAGIGGRLAAGAQAAHHASRPRPNLVVLAHSLHVRNAHITATFIVLNAGGARAGGSSVTLSIRSGRRRWTLKIGSVSSLRKHQSEAITLASPLPVTLPAGVFTVWACADAAHQVTETSGTDNCLRLGLIRIAAATHTPPPTTHTPPPTTHTPPPTTHTPPPASTSTVPTAPIAFTADTPEHVAASSFDYWVDAPPSYDTTGHTPMTLLVWLHGCGGESSGDIYTVDPGDDRDYLAMAVGGREDDCWNPITDVPTVLAAVADVKTHFNVNPRRVILGGYSSGGDLAYRTIFLNASQFAGLLAENTSPFRDTGMTQAQLLAAATRKFPVVHLAHLQDTTYPFNPGVRQEIEAMQNAGFPVTLLTTPGDHYDNPGEHGLPGTDDDTVDLLLPHIDDGWLAPA